MATDPANDGARYDYLRALLQAGEVERARQACEPVAVEGPVLDHAPGRRRPLDRRPAKRPARRGRVDTLEALLAANKRDFDARFELAQRHFAGQRFTQAMDELLEIIMRDKAWRDELARKTYVAILEVMSKAAKPKAEAAAPKGTLEVAGKMTTASSDPVVDAYRRKLSMALF